MKNPISWQRKRLGESLGLCRASKRIVIRPHRGQTTRTVLAESFVCVIHRTGQNPIQLLAIQAMKADLVRGLAGVAIFR